MTQRDDCGGDNVRDPRRTCYLGYRIKEEINDKGGNSIPNAETKRIRKPTVSFNNIRSTVDVLLKLPMAQRCVKTDRQVGTNRLMEIITDKSSAEERMARQNYDRIERRRVLLLNQVSKVLKRNNISQVKSRALGCKILSVKIKSARNF